MLAALPLAGAGVSIADAGKAPSAPQRGTAVAHDGTPIPFEVYGRGTRFVMAVKATDSMLKYLVDRYRVIMFDYPAEPMPYTLTPAAVTADFLRVADAAGAQRFAYYGYSWSAVAGLQLAIRTERLAALMCGGWPVVGGPYDEWSQRVAIIENTVASGQEFGFRRGMMTFYQLLRGFDDRKAQARISCPRLCMVGTEDEFRNSDGTPFVHFGEIVEQHRAEMEQFGWAVRFLEGKNHLAAMEGDVVGPVIRPWLDASWKEA